MKKFLALLMVSTLSVSLFACTPKSANQTPAPSQPAQSSSQATPAPAVGPVLNVQTAGEPKTIDPALNSSVDGGTYDQHLFEGLTRTQKDGLIGPGVAESWTISPDGLVYTFKLRDAKWSDGKPVTADDFDFAWRRVANPDNAVEYSYQMYYVKNAEAINAAKMPMDQLGIKVIDPKTFEVTLEAPCAYFLELTAFPVLFPVRKDLVEKDNEGWSTKVDTFVSNGPFKLTAWEHNAKLVMEKNENYWDKASVVPSKIVWHLIEDDNALLGSFKNGEIQFADSVPTNEIDAQQKEGKLKIESQLGTYFYVFNTQKAPFDNPKVREALTLALDRRYLVDAVAKGNQIPAGAWVSPGVPDMTANPDFRTKGGNYFEPDAAGVAKNIEKAKQLLTEAGFPNGKGFPKVNFITNDTTGHIKLAEAAQQMWKENLNIDVEVSIQEWAVFQQTRRDGKFDIARHGWLGDYNDPMTFLDMWISGSGQNDAKYKNPEYDRLVGIGKTEPDRAKRMDAMHKAEDILMKDYAIMPLYYYTDMWLIDPNLKGMVYVPLGFKFFTWATYTK